LLITAVTGIAIVYAVAKTRFGEWIKDTGTERVNRPPLPQGGYKR